MQIVVLILAVLAVARLSMLVVEDRLLMSFRRWVITHWGQDSLMTYMVFCHWCISIWIGLLVMPVSILLTWGISTDSIVVSVLSVPVASLVAGLFSRVRGPSDG